MDEETSRQLSGLCTIFEYVRRNTRGVQAAAPYCGLAFSVRKRAWGVLQETPLISDHQGQQMTEDASLGRIPEKPSP